MKFSLSWLKQYLDFPYDVENLCNKLTMIGLEVEEIIDQSQKLNLFEVAYIKEAVKHENSNKLKICKVENSSGEINQIICGAKNARAGIKVAMAKIGAVVPTNEMVIKKAKIAGVESSGMLCSASELGVGEDGEGIIEIDEKWPVGTKISDVYNQNEVIIDINITPNRGDCLGVYGIARDLAAAGFGQLKSQEKIVNSINFESNIKPKINSEEDCKLALFREIRNVKNCQSPQWLKDKLESIGQNSISALVDITNYVMFCLNRPMHAYDLDKLNGEIAIRKATNKEKFTSLKDLEYELNSDILIVSDEQDVVAVAGVIGSKGSSCEEKTQNILLESAFFDQIAVAKSGRKLNILSESRYRFERGVDYKSCIQGMELATKLITEICGGEISDIKTVKSKYYNEELTKIDFDINLVEKLIGVKISQGEIINILQSLEFSCEEKGDNLIVTVPSFRTDIKIANDLVEEIIRIYGYDKIIATKSSDEFVKPSNYLLDSIREKLIFDGYIENINWSFCDSKSIADFSEYNENLSILNPISENFDYMRPNLIIGLLNSYKKNYLRGNLNGSFFEIGKIFNNNDQTGQKNMISGIRAGKNNDKNHYNNQRNFDIFDVKKDFINILSYFNIKEESLQIDSANNIGYYHPHRSAVIKLGKNIIGYFGEIHPKILKNYDIKNNINIFEIFIDNLPAKAFERKINKKPYQPNDLQPIYRDFAFLVDNDKKISDLTKLIKSVDKKLISEVEIFDIYQGENIDKNKKSIALKVIIQPYLKNMTSDEIETLSQNIIQSVSTKFEAELRS